VPRRVHLAAAREQPAEQRPADPTAAEVGADPALEGDLEGAAEGVRGEDGGVPDDQAGVVGDGQAVGGQVDPPAVPPLGQVVGIRELAGVVELLGSDQQRRDRGHVVSGQWPCGQAGRQRGKVGHGVGA